MGFISTQTSQLCCGRRGRRDRILSARESGGWEVGPERSRVRSTSRREPRCVADLGKEGGRGGRGGEREGGRELQLMECTSL